MNNASKLAVIAAAALAASPAAAQNANQGLFGWLTSLFSAPTIAAEPAPNAIGNIPGNAPGNVAGNFWGNFGGDQRSSDPES